MYYISAGQIDGFFFRRTGTQRAKINEMISETNLTLTVCLTNDDILQ